MRRSGSAEGFTRACRSGLSAGARAGCASSAPLPSPFLSAAFRFRHHFVPQPPLPAAVFTPPRSVRASPNDGLMADSQPAAAQGESPSLGGSGVPGSEPENRRRLSELRVIDLRAELKRRSLDSGGNKSVLLQRLRKVSGGRGEAAPAPARLLPPALLRKMAPGAGGPGQRRLGGRSGDVRGARRAQGEFRGPQRRPRPPRLTLSRRARVGALGDPRRTEPLSMKLQML